MYLGQRISSPLKHLKEKVFNPKNSLSPEKFLTLEVLSPKNVLSWHLTLSLNPTRGRHGTVTVTREIFSPRDRVQDFFSPRDSLEELQPGIPRPQNLGPGPGQPLDNFEEKWVLITTRLIHQSLRTPKKGLITEPPCISECYILQFLSKILVSWSNHVQILVRKYTRPVPILDICSSPDPRTGSRILRYQSRFRVPLILNLSPDPSPGFYYECRSRFPSQISGTGTAGSQEPCSVRRPLNPSPNPSIGRAEYF